ncbi:hypothetical protein Fmac_017619 [Flemingia macrophylla]|uniref:EF-hand domain-containing protein n=1 Tax=Flemingia macrophylla TaxID=520843 RepID=A0ABD1M2M4_9FABA
MGLRSLFNHNKEVVSSRHSTSLSARSRTRMAAELDEVFKKFDVNGDGKISTSELGSIMRSLGQATLEQELENMIYKRRISKKISGVIKKDSDQARSSIQVWGSENLALGMSLHAG